MKKIEEKEKCECGCENDSKCTCECDCGNNMKHHGHCMNNGGIYGLGFIGAAIFFIGNANTFKEGVIAFLKAIVWPVFMVLEAFKFLIK